MKKSLFIFLCIPFFGISQNYFQQKVDYKISVKLNDKTHFLNGYEEFVYQNNSPNELNFIYIHLWPNAYKDKNTSMAKQFYRDGKKIMQHISEKNRGYIDSLDFKINGEKATLQYNLSHNDIGKLILNKPLKPGEKITVSTPFRVKIPSGRISRLGHIGQAYQITQWYPKPAVYDKDGWHQMPYLTQGEFYSEFGSFDVSISVPRNYIVGATGNLQTKSELDFLTKLAKQNLDNIKNKTLIYDPKQNFSSSKKFKTLRYIQKNVHDFAWFTDKTWKVLKGEVELPNSKRKVTSWAMYTPRNAELWEKSIEYLNDGTFYYSKWNGDYPYNNVTAVDGTISAGGGMEYPTITVIGNTNSAKDMETVIVHEVGHNWFYGILGSNERVHPWLDEGLNTANEIRYFETKYPNNTMFSDNFSGIENALHIAGICHHQGNDLMYNFSAGEGKDQPIETHSNDFTPINYGTIAYAKTGLVFSYLRDYLGDELYDKCMQEYYSQWHFKHPQPADLRKVFETKTGKDLAWFFDDIIKTTKRIDYRISSLKNKKVKLKNRGQIGVPVRVDGFVGDSLVESIWIEPNTNEGYFKNALINKAVIDYAKKMPETNRSNNILENGKLFSKIEPINFEFLLGDNEPEKNTIWWTPIIAANVYDNFMLGVLFHNISIPKSKIEFTLAPMYSFGRQHISGFGDIRYNHIPSKHVSKIEIGVKAQTFMHELYGFSGDYYAVKPYLHFNLGKPKSRVDYKQGLELTGVYTRENFYNRVAGLSNGLENPGKRTSVGGIAEYKFSYKKGKYKMNLDVKSTFVKSLDYQSENLLGSITFTNKYKYWEKKGKEIEVRFFIGKNLFLNGRGDNRTRFALGGQNGTQDFFYEHLMFGRNETRGLYAQQRIENHGNFKTVSNFGGLSDFMFTTNLYTEIPYVPLLGVFADFGIVDNNFNITGGLESVSDLGLGIRLFNNNFSVYYPVWQSDNLKNSLSGYNWYNKIRFNININAYSLKKMMISI